jgi:TPR repeat protein
VAGETAAAVGLFIVTIPIALALGGTPVMGGLRSSCRSSALNAADEDQLRTKHLPKARQGDANAMLEIARSFDREGKAEQAWGWYCRAANQGHSDAQMRLANYHKVGYAPVQKDLVEAYKWLSIAANNGHEDAEANKSDIASKITSAQITGAREMAARWKPDAKACEVKGGQAVSRTK